MLHERTLSSISQRTTNHKPPVIAFTGGAATYTKPALRISIPCAGWPTYRSDRSAHSAGNSSARHAFDDPRLWTTRRAKTGVEGLGFLRPPDGYLPFGFGWASHA